PLGRRTGPGERSRQHERLPPRRHSGAAGAALARFGHRDRPDQDRLPPPRRGRRTAREQRRRAAGRPATFDGMGVVSELTYLVLKFGFLALMWVFVFIVVYALRSDLFGQP